MARSPCKSRMSGIPAYELARIETIRRNQEELKRRNVKGLPEISKLAQNLGKRGKANIQEKNSAAEAGSDDDYNPGDEGDEQLDDILEDEPSFPARAKSKTMQDSTTAPSTSMAKKRSRPTSTDASTTSRSLRSRMNLSTSEMPNPHATTPSSADTSPPAHLTSRSSNSPNDNSTDEGISGTTRRFNEVVSLHGQDAQECSTAPSKEKGGRRPTMGRGLHDYSVRHGKMHIDFSAGKKRPVDPIQAAKLSSECGIYIRNTMPIATKWKDYQKNQDLKNAIPTAIGTISGKFDMDKNGEGAQKSCTDIFQKNNRNHRYKLKRDYFDGVPAEEVLANKPPNMTAENWARFCNNWSQEKFQRLSAKNKNNRKAVKHKHKTGSRSYVAHYNSLKLKNNNQEPSPIEFFKETHTNKKNGTMSEDAQIAYNEMANKLTNTQPEGSQPMTEMEIVSEVLKENNTFLANVGLSSSSKKTSAAARRIQELEERLEAQDRDAKEAQDQQQEQLAARFDTQQEEIESLRRKQEEELEAMKKSHQEEMDNIKNSQNEKISAFEKKQQEMDALIRYLLRQQTDSTPASSAPPPHN